MLRFLSAIAIGAFTSTLFVAPASATPEPEQTLGTCNAGWYVNLDETNRKPTPGPAGLKFEGNDLIHRATSGSVATLTPGTYVASPAPDQPSFFSVEVRNVGGAYGTLRWNPTTSKWSITIGAPGVPNPAVTVGTFEDASPVALLAGKVTKWGAFNPATDSVVSFGVGYTNSPPGTVATTVTSVTFKGTTYDMKCVPAPSASASASATVSATSSAPPAVGAGGGELALTGTRPLVIAGVAVPLLALGVALLVWSRRRKPRFQA